METARLVENRADVINMASINWGPAPNADKIIIESPFTVFAAVDRDGMVESSRVTSIFDLALKGSGVLGLLIGGLSVSNTLQVILARRKLEIAMLKTVGYHRSDLLALISLETSLIGLAGGVAGAALGTVVAGKLMDTLAGGGATILAARSDDRRRRNRRRGADSSRFRNAGNPRQQLHPPGTASARPAAQNLAAHADWTDCVIRADAAPVRHPCGHCAGFAT